MNTAKIDVSPKGVIDNIYFISECIHSSFSGTSMRITKICFSLVDGGYIQIAPDSVGSWFGTSDDHYSEDYDETFKSLSRKSNGYTLDSYSVGKMNSYTGLSHSPENSEDEKQNFDRELVKYTVKDVALHFAKAGRESVVYLLIHSDVENNAGIKIENLDSIKL